MVHGLDIRSWLWFVFSVYGYVWFMAMIKFRVMVCCWESLKPNPKLGFEV
jgi:hypothetical protein